MSPESAKPKLKKQRNKTGNQVFAVVPAAGLSERMGKPKLSLELGSRTVLEHVLAALDRSNADHALVVIGISTRPLLEVIRPPAELAALLVDPADMRASVEAGLFFLEAQYQPGLADAFLLVLGDQPALRPEVVDALIARHQEDPTKIRVPTYNGKRGHPVLFPWFVRNELVDIPGDAGIDELVRAQPDRVVEWECEFEQILDDLDAPADYEREKARTWS